MYLYLNFVNVKTIVKNVEKIVVVGTSAGGMKVLVALIEQLPENFPAPLLIVQHISAEATGDAELYLRT
ncbi:MAG: hypothetical protein H7239_02900 [Flavobacterium sp.]|nr:hypothetical protein [Flavobacterium sp.]